MIKEIKAHLVKPYTEKERIDFIVENNHNKGYTIEELENGSLQAFEMIKTDEEKAQEERERLDMLFMTGSDVERAIYKVKGIDFDDILAMVKDTPAIDAKALKIEFKANNFYRGNPYISQVGALLGFTSEQMDRFFETKDYHYLNTCKLTIKPTPENATVTIEPNPTPYDETAHYKVECEGYKTVENDIEMLQDTELEIKLEAIKETSKTEEETEATDKDNLTVDEEDE